MYAGKIGEENFQNIFENEISLNKSMNYIPF